MAKVLVTGAAGFVGSHTVEALLAAEHNVTGVDNLRTGREENLLSLAGHPNWTFIQQDILDEDNFHGIVRATAPDAVIHLAGLVSVPESIANPRLNFELNIRAVRVMIEAATKVAVPRVIFASSAAVYGDSVAVPFTEDSPTRPISPYGVAKLEGEAMILAAGRAKGFDAVCLRHFNIYGPRQRGDSPYSGVVSIFLERMCAGRPLVIFGDGLQTRDFIHVRDVAHANVLAVGAPAPLTGIFNICSGYEVAVNELAAALRLQFSSPLAPIFESGRPGDARRSAGSTARAREILGFSAGIAITAGLSEIGRTLFLKACTASSYA
jgi:UDP-glucose 4-epimerase